MRSPNKRPYAHSYLFVLRCLLNLASSSPFSCDIRIDNTALTFVEDVQPANKALGTYLARYSRPIQPLSQSPYPCSEYPCAPFLFCYSTTATYRTQVIRKASKQVKPTMIPPQVLARCQDIRTTDATSDLTPHHHTQPYVGADSSLEQSQSMNDMCDHWKLEQVISALTSYRSPSQHDAHAKLLKAVPGLSAQHLLHKPYLMQAETAMGTHLSCYLLKSALGGYSWFEDDVPLPPWPTGTKGQH